MSKLLWRNPLFVIFFAVFVDMLGFGILLPVIPYLLADSQSSYSLLSKGMTVQDGYVLLGYLAAAYPMAQFFSAPILGQLSDTFGRKKILFISLGGTLISYVLFAFGIATRNIPLLFASRIFGGVLGGNISVAQAAIADISTPPTRIRNFGLIGAAFGLGFILGPYLGGKLSDPSVVPWFNATTPFLFAALLCLFNILFIIFFLPETLLYKKEVISLSWNKSLKNIRNALSQKGKRELYITVLLFQGGIAFFTTFIGVYLIKRFHLRQGSIGEFFAYAAIWIAFTQAIITALISISADEYSQGESLGIGASLQAFAQSIPPILSGYIAAIAHPSAPIFVAAVVIIVSGLTFIVFYKPPHVSS